MKAAFLPDRGVVKVSGEDARTFLNGLVTTDVTLLQPGLGRFGALLTPQGKIARYFFRLEYPPRDLSFALIEAAANRIGSPLDALALLCYHYNPVTGKYSVGFMELVRLAGIATVLLMAAGVAGMSLYGRHGKRPARSTGYRPGGQAFRCSGVQVFRADKDRPDLDLAGPEHPNTRTPEHLNTEG